MLYVSVHRVLIKTVLNFDKLEAIPSDLIQLTLDKLLMILNSSHVALKVLSEIFTALLNVLLDLFSPCLLEVFLDGPYQLDKILKLKYLLLLIKETLLYLRLSKGK